ncbi:MAG: hypothetical protein AAF639_39290, partial [Chloroflexota bacterium]
SWSNVPLLKLPSLVLGSWSNLPSLKLPDLSLGAWSNLPSLKLPELSLGAWSNLPSLKLPSLNLGNWNFGGGIIPGLATGGMAQGLRWVGEQGRELMYFPQPAHVLNNQQSRGIERIFWEEARQPRMDLPPIYVYVNVELDADGMTRRVAKEISWRRR